MVKKNKHINFTDLCENLKLYLLNKEIKENFIKIDFDNFQREIQEYLLEQIKHLKITNKKSITYEKLSQLINSINDISCYYIQKKKSFFYPYDLIFNDRIKSFLNENPIDKILNNEQIQGNYIIDSENTLIDFGCYKTFEQYIHTTSNLNTAQGQKKLFFDVNLSAHKNIYLISSLINKNYTGQLIIDTKDIELFNLLPFLSMVSKITSEKSMKTKHETLEYFFSSPLIIIGSDIWNSYCNQIINIYTDDNISVREWIYSCYYNKKETNHINCSIIEYLKSYTIYIITKIDFSKLNKKYSENEILIISQLYTLINSIIFFMEKFQFIDTSYTELVTDITSKIEIYVNDYNNSCILIKPKYTKRINFDLLNDNKLNDLKNIFILKNKVEIINLNDEKLSLESFLIEIATCLEITEFEYLLNDISNKKVEEFFRDFRNIFSLILNDSFFENINQGITIFFNHVLSDYPHHYQSRFGWHLNPVEEKISYILLLLLIYKKEDDFVNFVYKKSIESLTSECFPLHNKPYWKCLLICELLLPNKNLNFNLKKDFNLKKIIYKYIHYFIIKDNPIIIRDSKDIIINAKNLYKNINHNDFINKISSNHNLTITNVNNEMKKIPMENINNTMINNIKLAYKKNMDVSDILFNEVLTDLQIFRTLLGLSDLYEPLPFEFATYIVNNFNQNFILRFIDFLDTDNKDTYLKNSLLWYLSNRFTLQLDFGQDSNIKQRN